MGKPTVNGRLSIAMFDCQKVTNQIPMVASWKSSPTMEKNTLVSDRYWSPYSWLVKAQKFTRIAAVVLENTEHLSLQSRVKNLNFHPWGDLQFIVIFPTNSIILLLVTSLHSNKNSHHIPLKDGLFYTSSYIYIYVIHNTSAILPTWLTFQCS